MKRRTALAVALGVALAGNALVAAPAPARAGETEPLPEPSRSDFWRAVREPNYARARALMMQGIYWLARTGGGPFETNAYIENAIERLERARALAPDDLDILFLLARAVERWARPSGGGDVERRDDDAIRFFMELRTRDPEYASESVAFSLGVLHTRTRDFAAAAAEYERALALALDPDAPGSGVMLSNLAEVTMLAGDVARAVRFYERAVAVANRTGDRVHLPLFGLAVALDRLGEHRQAVETAGQAVVAGGGTLDTLRAEDVFFEPAWEIHWYEGLGHLALASSASGPEERNRELGRARTDFQRFLDEGGRESPWAAIARDHVERLDRELAAPRRRPH